MVPFRSFLAVKIPSVMAVVFTHISMVKSFSGMSCVTETYWKLLLVNDAACPPGANPLAVRSTDEF